MAMLADASTSSNTPILNSGIPPRAKRFSVWGVLLGAAIGAFPAYAGTLNSHFANFRLWAAVLVFIPCVALHEGGHLAAGWLVGFHFDSISVGPFSIRREYGRLKVHLRTGQGTGFAGMHIDRIGRLRRRLLIYIAAGPAVNILAALLAGILIRVVLPSPSSLQILLGTAMWLLWFVGLSSLIPLGFGGITDGSRIAMLLFSPQRARRWISIIALGKQSQHGIRARCWRKTWIRAAINLRDRTQDELTASLIAYTAAMAEKEIVQSGEYLERCLHLASSHPRRKDMVFGEAAFFLAWCRGNTTIAEKWRAQIKRPNHYTRLMQTRLNVALACSRREFDAALSGLGEGLAFINQLPETPVRQALSEGWLEWRGDILERQNEPAEDGEIAS